MRKKTLLNLLLILLIAVFFIPQLGVGYFFKIMANRAFASSPEIIQANSREKIADYNWRLKDESWDIFSFQRSEGKWIFINFWASWKLPSEAEMNGIAEFYEKYGSQIDFYIITNEERPPVEEFMERHEYDFPVTYLIIGDPRPIEEGEVIVPSSYLISPEGEIVVHTEGIAKWNSDAFFKDIDTLLATTSGE